MRNEKANKLEFVEKMRKEAIRECINRCEKEFDEAVYNECLELIKIADLRDSIKLKDTIKTFLYRWGRMGRVLGRDHFINWETKLLLKIKMNRKALEELRSKDLSIAYLDRYESIIKNCYASFRDVVGPIAAAKVLHLICPNFFPLWDNSIATAIRNERKGRKDDRFSPEDFFKFMKDVQNFANKYEGVLCELVSEYKKGKLRILDEFFWWMTQRPLSLFMI